MRVPLVNMTLLSVSFVAFLFGLVPGLRISG